MTRLALVFGLLTLPAIGLAHSGGTDYRGGHRVGGTGAYHYHHGFPAHQHTGGRCPYNNVDATKHRSGAPSRNTSPAPKTGLSTGTKVFLGGAALWGLLFAYVKIDEWWKWNRKR